MFIGYLIWIIQSQKLLISILKATWVCRVEILTDTPLVLYLESKLMKLCVWIVSHSPFWGNIKGNSFLRPTSKNGTFSAIMVICSSVDWLDSAFTNTNKKWPLIHCKAFFTFHFRMKDSTYSFALVDSNCIRCTRMVEKYSCWVTSSSYVSQGNSFSGL